jgi:hypothetical protein
MPNYIAGASITTIHSANIFPPAAGGGGAVTCTVTAQEVKNKFITLVP